jgi:hypothetical protein
VSGTRIVHSYSPRKEFLRRLAVALAVIAGIVVVAFGGLIAVRKLQAQPAPPLPQPQRVVTVDVQPER